MPSRNIGPPRFSATVVLAAAVPEDPSIVTMPRRLAVAELLAVSVSTLVPVAGSGFHAAVTPAGSADVTARLTLPLNPASSVTVTVVERDCPGSRVSVSGDAAIVKPGALTSSATSVLPVKDPEVPATLIRYDPRTAELPTVRISVLLAEVGLLPQDAVTPLGKPDTASSTLPVNPLRSLTVMVVVPELPGVMVRLVEDAES